MAGDGALVVDGTCIPAIRPACRRCGSPVLRRLGQRGQWPRGRHHPLIPGPAIDEPLRLDGVIFGQFPRLNELNSRLDDGLRLGHIVMQK